MLNLVTSVSHQPSSLLLRMIAKDESSRRLLIAICTLREAENVVSMLTALRQHNPKSDLLVVDDSSDDGTAELARQFADQDSGGGKNAGYVGGSVLDPEDIVAESRSEIASGKTFVLERKERGLGGAIRASMEYAIEHDYDLLVNLDADFSHDPAAVPSLVKESIEGQFDVVVGSRYVSGGQIKGWPWYRRWMSRQVNRLAIYRFGLPVSDCSGSMRCYRVSTLRKLDPGILSSEGYSVLEEVIMRIAEMDGTTFSEVPITFVDREAGKSKLTAHEAIRSIGKLLTLRRGRSWST